MSSSDQGQDDARIRAVQTAMQEAWNRHDAKAFGELCVDDIDFVNALGWWWKGRAQVDQKHTEVHAFVFRDSILTNDDVQIRFLSPEIAVAHVRWSVIGHRTPDGTTGQPRRGIIIEVLHKQAGTWQMVAFQNTDSVPERTLPAGPPVAR